MSYEVIEKQVAEEIDSFNKNFQSLTKDAREREWPYFEEYARRFDNNPQEKRYGILVMDQEPKEENMIYADCPRKLRIKHIEALRVLGTGNPGERQRHFLNWLEKMEGKA